MTPSQDALDIDAALKQLRVARGTKDEQRAMANLDAVVARVRAKGGC